MVKNKLSQNLFTSPWIIGLFLFLIFLIANGYKYGWDDQHLEIPMLKSLIDPTYYPHDYYVEALKKSFPSYFYRLLSKVITVEQIPSAYLALYVISRYFMFFWLYKLWFYISKNQFSTICAILTFFLMVRVDEFLYRTFSHQEFVLPIIFAGFYYFYKERFFLASFLFGLSANIHGIYSLFPMLYMLTYLAWEGKKYKFLTFFKAGFVYTLSALPFIILVLQNRFSSMQSIDPNIKLDWLALFVTACPQNFIFSQAPLIPFAKMIEDWSVFFALSQSYIFVLLLFLVNLSTNKFFQKDKKVLSICSMSFFLLIIWGIFTYVHPNRFVLDLNLVRNLQFLTLFLVGYLVLFLVKNIEHQSLLFAFILGILFTFLKFSYTVAGYSLAIIFLVFLILDEFKKEKSVSRSAFVAACIGFILFAAWQINAYFSRVEIRLTLWINLLILFTLLILNYFWIRFSPHQSILWRKRLFILIPLAVFAFQYTQFHFQKIHIEKTEGGFWQLQRNWENMQLYVRDHTDKDDIIFTPYNMEMGGFRILSERNVVVCYRDIGIIGFDYSAAVEWSRRIHDVEAFQVSVSKPIMNAIQNAIMKYNADYIVFMRYAKPVRDTSLLKHVYTNESFSLYRVNRF